MQRIIVCWDKTISAAEGAMIEQAARNCINYFPGITLNVVGREAWTKNKRTSGETVMKSAERRNGQVNVYSVMQKVCNARDAEKGKYRVVVFTGEDLNAFGDGLSFCFGARVGDTIVESVHRFRGLRANDEKLCILRILRHELGHMYGAAANKNPNHPKTLYRAHCTNSGCSMRQTLSVNDVLRMAKEENAKRPFCAECEADIARRLAPKPRLRTKTHYYVR